MIEELRGDHLPGGFYCYADEDGYRPECADPDAMCCGQLSGKAHTYEICAPRELRAYRTPGATEKQSFSCIDGAVSKLSCALGIAMTLAYTMY